MRRAWSMDFTWPNLTTSEGGNDSSLYLKGEEMTTRIEKDSMGPLEVPADAYYGVQTQRAVTNFPISGWPLPPRLIHAMEPDQTRRRQNQFRTRPD